MYVIKLKDETNGILCLSGRGTYGRRIVTLDKAEVFHNKPGNSLHQAFKYKTYNITTGNYDEPEINGYKKSDFEIREVKLTLI